MTYEELIRRERANMSKSFAKLADFLLDSYVEASFMTASELAHALNLDAATVVRFSQNLGYPGFPQLQREIRQKVKGDLLIRPHEAKRPNTLAGVASAAMQDLITDLEQTRISLDTAALEQIVELLGQARRTTVLADAPSQPAAYNLVYFLEHGGFPIYIARPGVVDLARTLHTATAQDLILAINIGGQSPNIANTLQAARARSIPTAAIVAAASLTCARHADVVLAAQAHLTIGSGTVVVGALIYILTEVLAWRYAERFSGAEQSIAELSAQIRNPDNSSS